MGDYVEALVVKTDHPLSRFKSQTLRLGRYDVSSIHMGFVHLILRQMGQFSLDRRMRQSRRLWFNPTKIDKWLLRQGFHLPTEWIFRADKVYLDIMIHEMGIPGGYFRTEFMKEVDNLDVGQQSVGFVCCSDHREYVFSSGVRMSSIIALEARDSVIPGFNLYGKALESLQQMNFAGSFTPAFGVRQLQDHNPVAVEEPKFKHTVLVLSDSMARQMESIHGGKVVAVSGATFGDLARQVDERGLKFSDFAFVILNCGINDAQRPFHQQKAAWRKMEKVLTKQAAGSIETKILVSLPFPQPSITGIKLYSEWIEKQLEGTNTLCLNWFKIEPNPFIVAGRPNYFSLDYDLFHLSHQGLRDLWIGWCNVFEPLKRVGYTVVPETHHQAGLFW